MNDALKGVNLPQIMSIQSSVNKHATACKTAGQDFKTVLTTASVESEAQFLELLATTMKSMVTDLEAMEVTTKQLMAKVVEDAQQFLKNSNGLRTTR